MQVSAGGGTEPIWSRDGRMLYFCLGNAVLRASIETGTRLGAGRPSRVFEGTFAFAGSYAFANYDVSPDGRRFVMVEAGSRASRRNAWA